MAVKAVCEFTVTDQTDATDVVTWHYATTGGVAPAKPSTTSAAATPPGWSRLEPTISSDADLSKSVYDCTQLVWGDGTCTWGDVSLSASFEAAKRAYNKAYATQQEVETARGGEQSLSGRFAAIDTALEGISLAVSAKYGQQQVEDAIDEATGLSYDNTFTREDGRYVFQARLMHGSVDVTSEADPDRFVWILRTEGGGDVLAARGVTYAVDEEEAGLRASVIGGYDDAGEILDEALADHLGRVLVTDGGVPILARTIWE